MFNLIIARRNCIKTHGFLSCFIHHNSLKKEKPLNEKDSSLTLPYLSNTCGSSHQSAISASKQFNIKITHNPDIVIETLKSYDFTDAQITKLLTKFPKLLFGTEKNIKPKLDYYLNLGYSRADLGNFIAKNPGALAPSLEKRIKPNVELLRLILKNNQHIINAINRSSWLLTTGNITSTYLPNIKTLESHGVGHAHIFALISFNPRALLQNKEKFAKIVHSVKEFGFNPLISMFVTAVSVLSTLSPLTWEKKVQVFKSLGLSQKDVYTAFVKHPLCMALSEKKIRRGVEFFRKEMKWDPSFVAVRPSLLFYSLEKRVIPRCSVMRVLASKGFVKHYPSLDYQFLVVSETKFLKKYVMDYIERVPEVLHLYKGKLE